MNAPNPTRVLVALDSNHPSSEALRQLAQLLDAETLELTGLYVEDEDLRRAARLPGLREISLAGQELELSLERIEADVARELARIRSGFEHAAQALRLRCRFEVARGYIAETLCAAATESDFVLVSRTLRTSGLRGRTAPHFGPLVSQARRILFVNEPWASGKSVVVLGDDPVAIATGRRLAEAESLELVVALPRTSGAPHELPEQSTLVRLPDWSEDAVADLCLQRDARLLIVSESASLDPAAMLTGLLDRLPCSMLKLG